MNIRDHAMNCEAKKHAYRQTQDGVVVSFVLHPNEVPEGLAVASLGTRYQLAMVEIDDNEMPKEVMGNSGPGSNSAKVSLDKTPPRADDVQPGGAKSKTWHELKASQQSGILCNDPAFHKFLNEGVRIGRPGQQRFWSKPVNNTEDAAEAVRNLCAVNSRADLDKNGTTGERWNEIAGLYRAWMQEPGVVE